MFCGSSMSVFSFSIPVSYNSWAQRTSKLWALFIFFIIALPVTSTLESVLCSLWECNDILKSHSILSWWCWFSVLWNFAVGLLSIIEQCSILLCSGRDSRWVYFLVSWIAIRSAGVSPVSENIHSLYSHVLSSQLWRISVLLKINSCCYLKIR